MVISLLVVKGFIGAIDSSGFNYTLHPVFDLITRSLSGAFGGTFVTKLFSEGPCVFGLFFSFLPMLFYLASSSVFKFGHEKNTGIIELIIYGPADGTSYIIASLIKDLILTIFYIAEILVFNWITAVINNLALGPMYFYFMGILFFLSMTVYSYGIFSSVITENPASALTLFIGIILFFSIIQMGSFMIIRGYISNFSNITASIIKWISPLFYLNLGIKAFYFRGIANYAESLVLFLGLNFVLIFSSHLILKIRGIRT
jgi:hypothetical protein